MSIANDGIVLCAISVSLSEALETTFSIYGNDRLVLNVYKTGCYQAERDRTRYEIYESQVISAQHSPLPRRPAEPTVRLMPK